MKRIVSSVIAAGAVLVLSATAAQAQVSFGVGGGISIPTGDFGDVAKTGWHGLANIGYELPSGLGVRGDFYYGQNSGDTDVSPLLDGKFKLAGGLANVSYTFKSAGNIKPYVIGSVGFFSTKFEDSDSESDVAFGGGAGVKFKAGSDSFIFVEGRYISINTEGSSANFIPVTVGVKFGL